MPFKNKRNSRDDKSEKPRRPTKPQTGTASRSASSRPDRTEASNNTKKKLFGDDFKKPFKAGFKKPGDKAGTSFSAEKRNPKSFGRPAGEDRPERRSFEKTSERKPYADRNETGKRAFTDRNSPEAGKSNREGKFSDRNAPKKFSDKPFRSKVKSDYSTSDKPAFRNDDRKWSSEDKFVNKRAKKTTVPDDGKIRLNRYIANAGICSRRKADELIAAGVVSVNGEAVTELGFKVDPAKDVIRYNGETLKREKMVYVLLNKPKDYITTTEDPQERKTVMNLVEKASRERIYPVGRLDRNTTGLLLMTNDGDLAEKLSHPRNNITKLYQVELNKSLSQGDLNKIQFGIELEDGVIKPDSVSYVAGGSKKEVGIQIHSGKNRVVRRIFETLGYEVVKLDRVVYSNLTKKDLPRGRWRYLEEKEIIQLKHLIK